MKKSRCLVALACIAGATLPASAADVTVRGSPSCAEYLAAKQKAKHGDTVEAFNDLDWFLGYISGLAVGRNLDVLKRNDNGQSMIDWLDVYCPLKPADYLSEAGNAYYGFLKTQNGQK